MTREAQLETALRRLVEKHEALPVSGAMLDTYEARVLMGDHNPTAPPHPADYVEAGAWVWEMDAEEDARWEAMVEAGVLANEEVMRDE